MVCVSIVIPTYNRLEQLKQVIAGLERQALSRDEFEVVIVSDGSVDGTESYLQNLETRLNLKPLSQPNQGPAAARNLGVAHASGEIVLFIDDDVVPTPHLIEEHLRMHQESGDRSVVIGPMLAPDDFKMSPWVRWEQIRLARQYKDMVSGKWQPTARQFYTGNTSLSRNLLTEIGGFDVLFRRAEDVEMAFRLDAHGVRFLYNPRAIGYHYAVRSFESWISTPYAYGRSDVIFARQKGQAWLLPELFDAFYTRHRLIQWITSLCLGRPGLTAVTLALLSRLIDVGARFNWVHIADMACSGIFNLRYYQGVADELNGRDVFFNYLEQRRSPA